MIPEGQFRDDVLAFRETEEAGEDFRPHAWNADDLQYFDELLAIKGPILREHVFKAFEHSVHKGVTFSLVWGYPSGRTYAGTENEANLKNALRDPSVLIETVETLLIDSRNALQTIKMLNRQRGLGTASTTKVAYFAEIETGPGKCLIFDKQVTKAILTLQYPELTEVKQGLMSLSRGGSLSDMIDTVAQKERSYPVYLDHAYRLARLVGKGTTGEDIERFLFTNGRELG